MGMVELSLRPSKSSPYIRAVIKEVPNLVRNVIRKFGALSAAAVVLALTVSVASADGPNWETVSDDFFAPPFGLNFDKHGQLLVGDPAGPTKLDPATGVTSPLGSVPGAVDVVQVTGNSYVAVTGEDEPGVPGQQAVYQIKNGNVSLVANIFDWEIANDFDGSGNDPEEDSISNPFDLAAFRGNKVLIADAGGNSIHAVDKHGNLEWVATLPYQDVDTQPIKDAVGCPEAPPDAAFLCELPPVFTVDPVATTVAVGPDGAIYAGELTGFPGPVEVSRIWRIESGARGVRCGEDPRCTQVQVGPMTSIIDISFGPDGTMYVLELDEAGWFLGETPLAEGGTVNACQSSGGKGKGKKANGTWSCEEIATGLPFPTAVAANGQDVFVTLAPNGFEGPFEVARLTDGD
jgi:hypothetical protein